MKQFRISVTVFVLLMVSTNFVLSAEYYVDINSGNNSSGDGSIGSPWETIQYAADQMASADICWIREGIYREKVTPKDGQTFQAYSDEKVVLSGCDIVSSEWSVHDGEIYKTNIETKVLQLFTDGVRVNIARYPNEDGNMFTTDEWTKTYLEAVSAGGSGMGRVTFYDIPSMPDDAWVGGYYIGHNGVNPYSVPAGRIIASSGNQITTIEISDQWRNYSEGVAGDGPGYIINALPALDAPQEWVWQDSTLYLWAADSEDPGDVTVEARVRIYAFDLTGLSNVIVKGLTLKAGSVLMADATGCVVDDCIVLYPAPFGYYYSEKFVSYGQIEDGTAGIFLSGDGNIVKNSYISQSWACGITLEGKNHIVENNIIEDTNWRGFNSSAIGFFGDKCTIQYNTINRTGHSGIFAARKRDDVIKYGRNSDILNNKILRVGYLAADCGTYYGNIGETFPK